MLSPKVVPAHSASTCHPGAPGLVPDVERALIVWEDDGGPSVPTDRGILVEINKPSPADA